MEIITHSLAAVVAAASVSSCSWAHPGANPYRGDPAAALADFAMPDETRRKLRALMATHRYTDIAIITRDDIVGGERYGDLREMHSGRGQICHGAVDRSAWSDQVKELGLVYCVDETCVIVPTVCNNVSLVTRKPEQPSPPAQDDAPIDIEPSAGLPPPVDSPTMEQGGEQTYPFFPPTSPRDGEASGVPDDRWVGVTPGEPCCFIYGGGGWAYPQGEPVVPDDPDDPQTPVTPPPTPQPPPPPEPPVPAVPEVPVSALMFAGLALIVARMRRFRSTSCRA